MKEAKQIIKALKALSRLDESETATVKIAFSNREFDFKDCVSLANKLNENLTEESSPENKWNSKKAFQFLSNLEIIQDNLSSFVIKENEFREYLIEFLSYLDYSTEELSELSDEELEICRRVLFSDFVSELSGINLINGILNTNLSISLKTVFSENNSLRFMIPIATLRITSESSDSEVKHSFFQLAQPDIVDFINRLQETNERITNLTKETREE